MAEITPLQSAPENPPESLPQEGNPRRFPLLGVVLLVAVVGLALYIGVNVLSVLFAVVAPPLPPMPPNIVQTSHENVAYGVDRWKYTSTTDGCTLLRYLQENGGVCTLAPMQCGEDPNTPGAFQISDGLVARCNGRQDFSIFSMTWFGLIIREGDGSTRLDLDREVFWLGTGPQ